MFQIVFLALAALVSCACTSRSAHAADATLDPGFGGAGAVTLTTDDLPAGDSVARGLALLRDAQGRMLALTTVVDPFSGSASNALDLLIYRLNANGSLDTTFNPPSGYVLQNLDWLEITQVVFDSQGRFVISGTKLTVPPSPVAALLALRLTPAGARDLSFGTEGIVGASFGSDADRATCIAVGANDDVYLGGSLTGANPNWVAFKFSGANGAAVSSWGGFGFGFQTIDFQQGSSLDSLSAIAVMPGDGLVLLGQACSTAANCRPAAARLTSAGALDPTFCASAACIASSPTGIKNGRRIVRDLPIAGFNTASGEVASGIRTPAGALVLAGRVVSIDAGVNARALVAQLTADGALDAGFGSAGLQTLALADAPLLTRALAVDSSTRVILAGTSSRSNLRRIFVARLLANGQPDTSFNDGVALAEYFPSPASDDRTVSALLPGSRIISAIGDFAGPLNRDAFVFRLSDVVFANGFERQ